MKRSPLKRSTKPLKRSKLAPRSKKQATRIERYKAMLKKHARPVWTCQKSGAKVPAEFIDFHHPYGRTGNNLFKVVALSRDAHDRIHSHPDEAYAQGWLQPEYRGNINNGNHPVPWDELITE